MPATVTKLGPGTLTIDVGSVVDLSVQVTSATVQWSKESEDDVTVLSGDVVPGVTTYSAVLSGEILQDLADASGVVATSWAQRGEEATFTYVPSTAAGRQVTGVLIVDPLDVGGEIGSRGTSSFEWQIVGDPTLTAVA